MSPSSIPSVPVSSGHSGTIGDTAHLRHALDQGAD